MKKIIQTQLVAIIVTLLLGGIVQNVNGQTYHNKYVPQAGTSYVSFVNTSNPLTSESWYIFTTANKEVIINKMDFNFPCSDPVQTWAYALQNVNNLGNIYFKDCFFVPDGTSIFCYGYENSTSNRGVILRIKIDATTGLVTGINFSHMHQSNSPIKSACWANNNVPGNNLYHYCFGIVAGDTVTRVVVNSAGFFTTNVGSNGSNYTSPFTNFIHSISYDPNENCFIVSGTYKDICFYCVKISNGVDFIKSDANVFGLTAFQGNLYFEYPGNNKTMSNVMKLMPDGKLFIAQSMRTVNNRYFIYIVHYDYYNNIVLSNTLYETTAGSMYLTNISADFNNIYILGHINTSPARKFVFQVEQNFPNNYKMQTMQDATVSTPAYLYAGEIEYLSSMSFSDAFFSMDISGAVNGEAYIVHAYDLNYNNCDNDINLTIVANQHTDYYFNVLTNAPSLTCPLIPTASFQHTINPCTALCWDMKSMNQIKSKINENLKNKNIFQSKELSKQKIDVFENQFVAREFDGLCSYKIIDISGKVVQEGITSNDNINNLKVPKSGFYVIVVIDENNNIEKQKVVIMK